MTEEEASHESLEELPQNGVPCREFCQEPGFAALKPYKP